MCLTSLPQLSPLVISLWSPIQRREEAPEQFEDIPLHKLPPEPPKNMADLLGARVVEMRALKATERADKQVQAEVQVQSQQGQQGQQSSPTPEEPSVQHLGTADALVDITVIQPGARHKTGALGAKASPGADGLVAGTMLPSVGGSDGVEGCTARVELSVSPQAVGVEAGVEESVGAAADNVVSSESHAGVKASVEASVEAAADMAARDEEERAALERALTLAPDHAEKDRELLAINAMHRSNVARFINHACDPPVEDEETPDSRNSNLVVQTVFARKARSTLLYYVSLFATRDIAPREELTYSYGQEMTHVLGSCKCGAPNCSGRATEAAEAAEGAVYGMGEAVVEPLVS